MPARCREPLTEVSRAAIQAPTVAEHRARQRRAILDAARAHLAEEGRAPSLAQVGARIVLPDPACTNFDSRNDLLAAVVADVFPDWADKVIRSMQAADTPGKQVWAYVEANMKLFASSEQAVARALTNVVDPTLLAEPVTRFHQSLQDPSWQHFGPTGKTSPNSSPTSSTPWSSGPAATCGSPHPVRPPAHSPRAWNFSTSAWALPQAGNAHRSTASARVTRCRGVIEEYVTARAAKALEHRPDCAWSGRHRRPGPTGGFATPPLTAACDGPIRGRPCHFLRVPPGAAANVGTDQRRWRARRQIREEAKGVAMDIRYIGTDVTVLADPTERHNVEVPPRHLKFAGATRGQRLSDFRVRARLLRRSARG